MKKESRFNKYKIAIIGAGAVGSTSAYVATIKNLAAEIILIDINDNKEEGEVMDMNDGLCFVETGSVKGADFKDAHDADIIIITAGAPQKKGETRIDLVEKNKKIFKSIFKSIGKIKKETIIVVVANPVDILTYIAQDISKLPAGQVFGTGTGLDTARLRNELAHLLKVSPQNIHGYVLGEHGDSEFIAWSSVTIGGARIDKLKILTATKKKDIEKRVRQEAYGIINRKGATYYGIALVVSEIIEAILYDQHFIMPVSTRINNWNGVSNVSIGVPAIIGRSGVEKIWPLNLNLSEKNQLKKSAKKIKQYLK